LFLGYDNRRTYAELAPRTPLYGIWNVEEFEVDGHARPALVTDATRWRRMVCDAPHMIALQLMSDSRVRYRLDLDGEQKALTLTRFNDPSWKTSFSYRQTEPGLLTLEGIYEGGKVRARLRRVEAPDFLLRSRGFHWINEYPFNR
jgi:hypothetical protein